MGAGKGHTTTGYPATTGNQALNLLLLGVTMKEVIPKKSLGQHWLHDKATLGAICDAANVQAGDAVLEVGPGLGTLTSQLLERGAIVTAVEFDPVLAEHLVSNVERSGATT